MKKIILFLGLLALIPLLWFGLRSYQTPHKNDAQTSPSPLVEREEIGRNVYSSDEYGLSFTYSPEFFVFERSVGTLETPQYSITLAEDTQENRDLFAGRVTEAREGPPTITIDIYPNTQHTSAQEWLENSTTWTLSNKQPTSTTVSNQPGLSFNWSGLYEGKSTIVSTEDHIYVISVTWLDETSESINEYQNIIDTLNF